MADRITSVEPDDFELYLEPVEDDDDFELYLDPVEDDTAAATPSETAAPERVEQPPAMQRPARGVGLGVASGEVAAQDEPERRGVGSSVRRESREAKRQPSKPDPFEGESIGETAKRRGQQFARGATEVVASVPEAAAIQGEISDRRAKEGAQGLASAQVKGWREQADALESELVNLDDPEERAYVAEQIQDLRRRADQATVIADGPVDVQPARDRDLYKKGRVVRAWTADTFGAPDPRDQSFWAQLAEGGGNMTGFAVGSLAATVFGGGVGGIVTGAGLGSSLTSSGLYREAVEAGISNEDALEVAKWGSAIGATEIIPIARALKMIPASARQKVSGAFGKRLSHILRSGGEEAAQEFLAETAQNIVASEYFDPERGWFEGAGEAALIGGILGVAVGGAGAIRPDRSLTPEDRASSLPDDVIAKGKAKLAEIEEKGKQGTTARFYADVPEGAVPMETLYGRGGLGPVEAPEVQERRPTPPNLGISPAVDDSSYVATPRPGEGVPNFNDPAAWSQPENTDTAPNIQERNGPPPTPAEPQVENAVPSQKVAAPKRPAARPKVQKRPFTAEVKRIGIHPDGALAAELRAQDITPSTVPGLFKRTGVKDMDNLPADEWPDWAPKIGEDGQGYLDRQGIIDALIEENAGRPVQVGRQAELQAELDAKAELEQARANGELDATVDAAPEADLGFIDIAARDQDIRTDQERRSDIEATTREAIGSTGLEGVLSDAEIGSVVDRLDANGGNVEDALWWAAERELEDAGRERTENDAEDIPFGDEAGELAPREGDADQAGRGLDPVRPGSVGPVEAESVEGGEDGQRAPVGVAEEGGRDAVAEAPLPTESTPEGEQTVIPGSRDDQGRDGLKDQAEIDARQQQSKMRRGGQERVEDDAGGLFGSQEGDLFDAPKAEPKKAKVGRRKIGQNANGFPLYEDDNGVRSYTESGVSIQETVSVAPGGGVSVDTSRRGNDFLTDAERGGPVDGPRLTTRDEGRAAGKAWFEAGKPEAVSDDPAMGNASADARGGWTAGYRRAKADAEKSAATLTPNPKKSPKEAGTKKVNAKSSDYGAKNKLVTQDRRDELKRRLREKLSNQLNAGIDPEVLAMGAELTVFHIEAGARKFADAIAAVAEDLGTTPDRLTRFARGWYNGARDMMEDSGVSIEGMDDADTVRNELENLRNAPILRVEESTNEEPELVQDGEPETGGRNPDGEPAGVGTDRVVEDSQPEDGDLSESPGRAGSSGARPDRQDAGTDSRLREVGDAADGREGTGGARDLDEGARGRRNFVISDPEAILGGGAVARFKRNQAAIEAFNDITAEGREPTQEEIDALAGYTGWGSFGQELFQGSWDRPRPKQGWEERDTWLRDHLGQEAWKSAQGSILNAHYTDPPTVQAIWSMVERMGFKGGRVLEPSMGIGNFFGLMPQHLAAKSNLTGIELDKTTGGMAAILYPDANVQIKGYEKSQTPDNFYDLIIGNWPFAKQGPADRRYNKLSPSLHDYFFVKALDQVRPGGLVVGITSAGTMDKQATAIRQHLAKNAELVASYRLPTGAFEGYAGTKVVTDLIVLKKRDKPLLSAEGEGWIESREIATPAGTPVKVNEYYHTNPDKVLGRINFGSGTTYGRAAMIVDRPADFADRLASLPETAPADVMAPITRGTEERFVTNNTDDRVGSIVSQDGELWVSQGEQLVPLEDRAKYAVKDPKKTAARKAEIEALTEIRKAYGKTVDAERDGHAETEVFRRDLNKKYKAFRKKYGPIGDSFAIKMMAKVRDPNAPMLKALERPDGSPSAVLTEPLVRAQAKLINPTITQAFVQVRNESSALDFDRIAELSGVSKDDAVRELVEAGAIYKLPGDTYDVSDAVLSGNVRKRLAQLTEARDNGEEGLDGTIEAVRAKVPEDIPYHKIEANLGAAWMGADVYKDFVTDILNLNESQASKVTILFSRGSWQVMFKDHTIDAKPEASTQHGHPKVHFDRMLRSAMNNETIKLTAKDEDGNKITDEEGSKEANEKVAKLRQTFRDWVWKEPARRVAVARTYNDVMNAMADPSFDGSFLEFPGMALKRGTSPFNLRAHQANAIWRGLLKGRGIYAHEVGTGKTYTMGGIAVESRRYGLARKPLLLAHNANSATVAAEIMEMYPGAKVLYVDNLSPQNLKTTLYSIRNDDWDAVVMPHSLIDRLTLSEDTLRAMTEEEIAALEAAALEAAAEDGYGVTAEDLRDPESVGKIRSVTAKELAKARLAVIARLEKNIMRASSEDAVTFEDLGVDMLLVDEVHEFKKPQFTTKMQMKGLNKNPSARSLQLQFLTRYIRQINGGKGVHIFTGTPITNTLGEMFHVMRYVMEDTMADANVDQWDSFFNTFADAETDIEIASDGQFEMVTRLSNFVNVADLRRLAADTLDVVFADDMPEFAPRTTKSGKTISDNLTEAEEKELRDGRTEKPIGRPYKVTINETAEMSPPQRAVQEDLARRYNAFRQAPKKERYEIIRKKGGDERNPLIIEGEAASAALDIRLRNPDFDDHPESKVNRTVRNVMKHYREHKLASQVIFMDKGYEDHGMQGGQKVARLNVSKDIKAKLIDAGVKEAEIAIVTGSTSKQKRAEIAARVAKGEVRIVMGGTSVLGVGVNMQANLRAMHHIDAPWMPGELEQRNGRGHRQGNHWNTVLEYRYMTERLDAKRWQALAKKQRFIRDFMEADMDTRIIDGDAADMSEKESADDIMESLSDAAGDPRIMQRAKLDMRVRKLRDRASMHQAGADNAAVEADRLDEWLTKSKDEELAIADDARHAGEIKDSETFLATIGKKTYKKRADAIEALDKYMEKFRLAGEDAIRKWVDTGVEVNGFKMLARDNWKEGTVYSIQRKGHYTIGKPTIAAIESNIRATPRHLNNLREDIDSRRQSRDRLRKAADEAFPQAEELAMRERQLTAIEADLESNPIPAPAWLRQGAVVDTKIVVDGKTRIVTGHLWGEDNYYILTDEGRVPYLDARGLDGGRIFDEREWVESPNAAERNNDTDQKQQRGTGTPTDPARIDAAMADLRKRLDKIGLKNVDLQRDADMDEQAAFEADGRGNMRILIGAAADPEISLRHEAIHALKASGVFTKAEWAALEKRARSVWMGQHKIKQRYSDLSEDAQIEEAIAEGFANWKADAPASPIKNAFAKVKRFFRAVRDWMQGQGIQDADDLFGAIERGEVGERESEGATETRKSQRQAARDEDLSDEIGERIEFAVDPETTTEERQESFLKAVATQPLDSAFKVLFMPVGGIDAQGKWRLGVEVERRVTDAVANAKFKDDSLLSFMNPAIERARIGLRDRHGLPEEYVEMERQRGIDQSLITSEGLEFVREMQSADMGPQEAQVLQAILTGEAVDEDQFGSLPAAVRQSLDEMGQEAVRLGLLSPEAYERNRGTYLHRVYEGHEAQVGPLGKMTGSMARGRRVKIAGEQFKGRGIFEEVDAAAIWKGNEEYLGAKRGAPQKGDKVIILDKMSDADQGGLEGVEPGKPRRERRVYWPAEKAIPARFASYENRGTFEVRGEPGKTITLWRDFTKEERTRMGEILDARYTVAKTYHMMAQDLATGKFFKGLAENEDWVKAKPPAGAVVAGEDKKFSRTDPSVEWVRVPATKIGQSETLVYGALAGKYIRADIWRDMEELKRMQSPGWWRPILTQWKLNKTARNPVVHMNNIMSNFMLMDMANVRITDLGAAWSEIRGNGELYEEAKTHGAFGADMVAQEIRRDVLEPILKELRDEIRDGKGGLEAEAARIGLGPAGWIADRMVRGVAAADRKMVSAYQMEDEIFRMATYIRRRKEGMNAQEAAIEARDQFLNYDIRAPWVNAGRNSVLPFISYTYRAIPRLFKTLMERPWKMAKYATVAYMVNSLGYLLAPSDDDEEAERGSLRKEEQGKTWVGTERLIRMPWLSGEDPVFLDTRRWIPGGDIFETGQNEALPWVPNWLQVGGPIVLAGEIVANRSLFTGEDIVNEVTDTGIEKAAKQAGHLYRSWMPSAPWIPEGWYWNKIGRALNDEARTYSGDSYRLSDALLSSVGIKLQPKDVDFGYQMHGFRFDQEERELSMLTRSLKRQRSRGLISQENYDREISRLREKSRRLDEARRETMEKRR